MLRRRGVPTWGHFLNKERQGGGCLIDLGTHAIDLALWMLGDFSPVWTMGSTYQGLVDQPTEVNRWGAWKSDLYEVEDAAFGTVRMASGATLEIASSFALNIPEDREDVLTLCGTKGGATLQGGKLTLNGVRDGAFFNETLDLAADWETACKKQVEDFIDCIRTGRQPLVTAREGLGVSRVLDGIYRSAAEKQPVML
jgi:predicted dehydrogenase